MAVHVEARAGFTMKDALTQPLVEEPGGAGVLVVVDGVRRTDFARDQADHVVRVLAIVPLLVARCDDVVRWCEHAGNVDPIRIVKDALERPDRRQRRLRA